MKSFAVIFLALALTATCNGNMFKNLTEKDLNIVDQVSNECQRNVQAPATVMQKLKVGDFSDADQTTKCFTNCFLEKLRLLADGVPREAEISERLSDIFGKKKIQLVMDQCDKLHGVDHCDTAFNLFKCYDQYTKKSA